MNAGKQLESPRQCTKCAKPETSLSIPLKWCAKCKGSFYCSRECQQQDWKVHKKICSKQAAKAAQISNATSAGRNGSSVGNYMGGTAVSTSGSSFQDVMARSLEAARAAGIDTGEDEEEWEDEDGGGNNEDFVSEFKRRLAVSDSGFSSNRAGSASSLDSLPHEKAYKFIVDAYRFRLDDEYNQTGDVSNDSLYGGGDPHADFKRFLNKAEKKGALPSWWSPAKRKECEKVSRPLVVCEVEQSDLRDEYPENPFITMELRALAEKVYGPIHNY